MNLEIVESPVRFHLHGIASAVEGNCYGEVGLRLMNELWRVVKQTNRPTTGINHWVYLADGGMFVGVELLADAQAPEGLEPLACELRRRLRHVHIGPYQALPEKWRALKAELAARGEAIGFPSLEIYGHHYDDPAQSETTILIGLQPKHA